MRPKIGTIARITNKFSTKTVMLGELDRETGEGAEIPIGTHVLLVRTQKLEFSGDNERFPIIVSEYGTGWVYWDELERIDEVQTG